MNEWVCYRNPEDNQKIRQPYGFGSSIDPCGRGEIYGLIGDNGAGKTTLLKALAGLIWPDHGDVVILGRHEEKALGQSRRQMGAMVEHAGYFPKLSVEKNNGIFSHFKRHSREKPQRKISCA